MNVHGPLLVQTHIVITDGDTELFTENRIEHLGGLADFFNRHACRVGTVYQDLKSHFTGSVADIVVSDGDRSDADLLTDAGFTGNDRLGELVGSGIGSSCIVGWNIYGISPFAGVGCDLSDIVAVGESETLCFETQLGKFLFDRVSLENAVRFS